MSDFILTMADGRTSCATLQEVAQQDLGDPVASLSRAGLSVSESAVLYLSPAQQQEIEEELTDMEVSMSFETTAWSISEKMNRARVANLLFTPRA